MVDHSVSLPPIPLPRDTARDARLDAARGLAIVLVVLGHALVGVMGAGAEGRPLRFALILLYSGHVALFFLLAGMLARSRPWPALVRRLWRRILWPYLLWGFVLYTAHFAMRDFTNTALESYAPWRILWRPPGVMWFLPVLGLGLVLHRLACPLGRPALALAGAGVLAAPYLDETLPQALRFAGLVPLAAALGRDGLARLSAPPGPLLAGLVMAAAAGLAWAGSAGPVTGYPGFAAGLVPALFAGPLLLVRAAGRNPLLAEIGRHTMAIFVTHVLVTAGTRIALAGAGVTDPVPAVLLGTVLGVALPLGAAQWAAARGWSAGLGWR